MNERQPNGTIGETSERQPNGTIGELMGSLSVNIETGKSEPFSMIGAYAGVV